MSRCKPSPARGRDDRVQGRHAPGQPQPAIKAKAPKASGMQFRQSRSVATRSKAPPACKQCKDTNDAWHAVASITFSGGTLRATLSLHQPHPSAPLQLAVNASQTSVTFDAIDIQVDKAPLKAVYNALLGLFHGQVVHRVRHGIRDALNGPAPDTVNHLLRDVPTQARARIICLFGRVVRQQAVVRIAGVYACWMRLKRTRALHVSVKFDP